LASFLQFSGDVGVQSTAEKSFGTRKLFPATLFKAGQ
jgi:hypothetical protein